MIMDNKIKIMDAILPAVEFFLTMQYGNAQNVGKFPICKRHVHLFQQGQEKGNTQIIPQRQSSIVTNIRKREHQPKEWR
jgi:hypothetical protein